MKTKRTTPAPTDAAQSLTAAKPLDYAHASPEPATDLLAMPPNLWEIFLQGYACGFSIGVDRGRELADEDAAAIHRCAVRVVRVMAKVDPFEDAQRRRRQRQVEAAEQHTANAQPWPAEGRR